MNYSGAEIRSWRVQSRSSLEQRTLSGVHRTCPVNYSEGPLKIPEGAKFDLSPLVHRTLSGAPDQDCLRLSLALFVEPISWSFYWLSVNLWHLYIL
jgi:hypothetical protein